MGARPLPAFFPLPGGKERVGGFFVLKIRSAQRVMDDRGRRAL